MPILLCSFPVAVAAPLQGAALLGIPATAFWMYALAALTLVIGVARILNDLPAELGADKLRLFAPLAFAIPMAVFGTEHFTITAGIASLIPRWIPAHTFFVYAVGLGFILAGLSMASLTQARLAASLVGITQLVFVLTMDLPGALRHPENRFFWALSLRELSFSCGAFAFALSSWSTRPRRAAPPRISSWIAFPRLAIGLGCVFYGVMNLLHPEHVPGVPLEKLTPGWIPARFIVSYVDGVVLLLAGGCLLANRKTRAAATIAGLAVVLALLWVYLPMLFKAPTEMVALNYFFDSLLYCGTLLLLGNAMEDVTVGPSSA